MRHVRELEPIKDSKQLPVAHLPLWRAAPAFILLSASLCLAVYSPKSNVRLMTSELLHASTWNSSSHACCRTFTTHWNDGPAWLS